MVSSPPVAQDDTNLQRQLAKLGEEVLAEDVPERLLQALTGGSADAGRGICRGRWRRGGDFCRLFSVQNDETRGLSRAAFRGA